MTQKHLPFSPLQILGARWYVLSQMLIAFARQVSGLERGGVRGAYAKAEALEMWACAASVQLAEDLCTHGANPASPEDEQTRLYLNGLFSVLMLVLHVARSLKQKLRAQDQQASDCGRDQRRAAPPCAVQRAILSHALYIDPG